MEAWQLNIFICSMGLGNSLGFQLFTMFIIALLLYKKKLADKLHFYDISDIQKSASSFNVRCTSHIFTTYLYCPSSLHSYNEFVVLCIILLHGSQTYDLFYIHLCSKSDNH